MWFGAEGGGVGVEGYGEEVVVDFVGLCGYGLWLCGAVVECVAVGGEGGPGLELWCLELWGEDELVGVDVEDADVGGEVEDFDGFVGVGEECLVDFVEGVGAVASGGVPVGVGAAGGCGVGGCGEPLLCGGVVVGVLYECGGV